MQASDIRRLAVQFMNNAVQVRRGDNIWIETQGPSGHALRDACARVVREADAYPHLVNADADCRTKLVTRFNDAQLAKYGDEMLSVMKSMQGYIRICDETNEGLIPQQVQKRLQRVLEGVTDHRVNHTRWLVVEAPTKAFAQANGMSMEEGEAYYLQTCLLDYSVMAQAAEPLKTLIHDAETGRVIGKDTHLFFGLEGMGADKAVGQFNLPDGEVFTAPTRDSANGTILYGPSAYLGQRFKEIRLVVKNGKAIEAYAENAERTAALNAILDTDEGARYFGEFAIAFNPYIKKPMGQILFDEKIDGSIHFALGSVYAQADNGNRSDVHWDQVHIQRPEYGGGEIWIDDRLIRKDGIFVVPELEPLNPKNLIAAAQKLRF